ncbi:hypothetical protein AgCh_015705 [Apium graveolens]
MERSSFDPSPSSTAEYYMNSPIQDDVLSDDPSVKETSGSGEAQIGGRGIIGNGTLEEYFQTFGGFHSPGGGFVMRGVRAGRSRRYNLTRSPFGFTSIEDGDIFDNLEGRRAQARGRGRGQRTRSTSWQRTRSTSWQRARSWERRWERKKARER